jgi:MFS family permease
MTAVQAPPASTRRRRFDFALLRHREYRLLFTAQTTSAFGDAFFAIALPWLVYQIGGGARQLGTVVGVYGVCRLAATPLGGVLADRVGAWRVMMVSDIARLLLGTGLAVVAATGRGGLPVIAGVGALIGVFAGLFLPASLAITPTLLPADRLHAGNALSRTGMDSANLIGPAIAGLAVAALPVGVAFAVDAATFAVSAACLAVIGAAHRTTAGRKKDAAKAPGFLHLLRTSDLLRAVLLVTIVANLTVGGMLRVGLPVLARTTFDAGSIGFGELLAAFSAGSILGSLVIAGLSGIARPGVVAMLSGLGMGIAVIAVPYAGLVGAILALFIAGGTSTVTNVLVFTLVQRSTPSHLLGKVMGAIMFCGLGLFPVSVAAAGLFVDRFGVVTVFGATGVLLIAAFLVGLTRPPLRRPVLSSEQAAG